MVSKQIK
jgi:DNA polymerase sigma